MLLGFVCLTVCQSVAETVPKSVQVEQAYVSYPVYSLEEFPYQKVLFQGVVGDQSGSLTNHIIELFSLHSPIAGLVRTKPEQIQLQQALKVDSHNKAGLRRIHSLSSVDTLLAAKIEYKLENRELNSRLVLNLFHLLSGETLYSFDSTLKPFKIPYGNDGKPALSFQKIERDIADLFRKELEFEWSQKQSRFRFTLDGRVLSHIPGLHQLARAGRAKQAIQSLSRLKSSLERTVFMNPHDKQSRSFYTTVLHHMAFFYEMDSQLKLALSLYTLAQRHNQSESENLKQDIERIKRRIRTRPRVLELLR